MRPYVRLPSPAHSRNTGPGCPLRSLDKLSLQGKLRDIGHMEGSTAKVTEA
jgi:hypothetical protein